MAVALLSSGEGYSAGSGAGTCSRAAWVPAGWMTGSPRLLAARIPMTAAPSRKTAHAPPDAALTAGFHRALLACAFFLLAAAAIGMRAANSRGEPIIHPDGTHAAREHVPAPELAE